MKYEFTIVRISMGQIICFCLISCSELKGNFLDVIKDITVFIVKLRFLTSSKS